MTPKCSVKGCRRVCRLKTYTKKGKRFHDVCDTHFTRPGVLITREDALRVVEQMKEKFPEGPQVDLVVPKDVLEELKANPVAPFTEKP